MKAIKDNRNTGQIFNYRLDVTGIHIDSHGFQSAGISFQLKQQWFDAFLGFAFRRIDNFPGLQVDCDSQIFVSLFETEFVDADVFDLFPAPSAVFLRNIFLMMIFDQVPAGCSCFFLPGKAI